MKKKARRRLIGAAALAVGAVVFLPMIFDSGSKAPVEGLSVQIPDKSEPLPANLPAKASGAGEDQSSTSHPPGGAEMRDGAGNAPTSAQKPEAAPAPGPASGTTGPKAAESLTEAAPKVDVGAPKKPLAKAEKAVEKAPVKQTPTIHDDPRAVAALEGKLAAPTSKTVEPVDGASAGNYVVQIGAFANSEKVKELRDRLSGAGLKSYTETLNTGQGARTRVRVGPYSTREAAEKARDRIKGLGLDGSVVTL